MDKFRITFVLFRVHMSCGLQVMGPADMAGCTGHREGRLVTWFTACSSQAEPTCMCMLKRVVCPVRPLVLTRFDHQR